MREERRERSGRLAKLGATNCKHSSRCSMVKECGRSSSSWDHSERLRRGLAGEKHAGWMAVSMLLLSDNSCRKASWLTALGRVTLMPSSTPSGS